MNVRVHIEQLVLEGAQFGGMQGRPLQLSVEQELSRLVEESGLAAQFTSDSTQSFMKGGSIQLKGGDDVAELGRQIATALSATFG